MIDDIRRIFNVEVVACHESYLGLPSSVSKNKRKVFRGLKDRIGIRFKVGRLGFFRLGGKNLEIQQLLSDFWWGFKGGKKKMHWMAWKRMCLSKEARGLGPSFVWRSILWGREILEKGIRWKVGSGSKISVFNDPWLPRDSCFKILSPKLLSSETIVSVLMDGVGAWNSSLVKTYFCEEETEIILGIPLSSRVGID
ncbi:hypothetical protein ACOSQ3_022646 [Xanthoceras sorbifolium]